jgi:hypothetical protein
MEFDQPILVYIKLNLFDEITDIGSSIFIDDPYNWIVIDSGFGDKYAHAQTQYFDKPLMNKKGKYNYKFINNVIKYIGD